MKSNYYYFIDSPQCWAGKKQVEVTGWVFHKQGSPIKKIRLIIKDKIFYGAIGIERPDVACHFKQAKGAYESGINIPIEFHNGINKIKIEILSHNNCWEKIGCEHVVYNSMSITVFLFFKKFIKKLFSRKNLFLLTSKKTRAIYFNLIKFDILVGIHSYFVYKKLSGLGHLVHYQPRTINYEKYPKKTRQCKFSKITVVTPSYNQAAFLEKTIQSVLDQKYPFLDYIIIDGGSKDESPKIIEKYKSLLAYSVSEPDAGQSDAIQKGFTRCTGGSTDIMAYLNSDDLYLPGCLEFVADYFEKHPKVDLIYGHRILIDDNNKEIGRWFTPRHNNSNLSILDYVPQETMFWRKRIYDKIGGIDPKFHFAMDWDFLLRAQEAGAVIKRVPYFLGCFRVHQQQKTNVHMSTIGEVEINRLRERSHDAKITHHHIAKVHIKNSIESALTQLLFVKGIRF